VLNAGIVRGLGHFSDECPSRKRNNNNKNYNNQKISQNL